MLQIIVENLSFFTTPYTSLLLRFSISLNLSTSTALDYLFYFLSSKKNGINYRGG